MKNSSCAANFHQEWTQFVYFLLKSEPIQIPAMKVVLEWKPKHPLCSIKISLVVKVVHNTKIPISKGVKMEKNKLTARCYYSSCYEAARDIILFASG